MSKSGQRIIRGTQQALDYATGKEDPTFVARVPNAIDVKAIREGWGLSQRQFAAQFRFE